jgi:hypothetical protein
VPIGRLRPARWLLALAGLGALLFTTGLLVQVRCAVHRCPARGVRRLFDLDALGALPRSFTTLVFLVIAVYTGLACVRAAGRIRWWWALVAVGAVGLALAKAVSTHSSLERDDGRLLTLVGGLVVTVVGLSVLLWTGRRWSVPGTRAVVTALAVYALAALGLDQVTGAVASVSGNRVLHAFAVFLEEGGEAATAVLLLATVVQAVPRRAGSSVGRPVSDQS